MKYKINKLIWTDIVLIEGKYRYVSKIIEFTDPDLEFVIFPNNRDTILKKLQELNVDNIFNLESFYTYLEKSFSCKREDIKTYVIDNICIPDFYKEKINLEKLGGYLNGIKI